MNTNEETICDNCECVLTEDTHIFCFEKEGKDDMTMCAECGNDTADEMRADGWKRDDDDNKSLIIIKLNRNMYYEDRDLGGLFCGGNLKINKVVFTESEPFQNPKSKSYNMIKRLTLRIKDAIIEFV